MRAPDLLRRLRRPKASAWLRWRLLTDNLSLKVLALVLALLLWGFVVLQKRGESTEIKFFSPLVFKNIPPTLEVANSPVQTVSVLVRAVRNQANSVNPSQFQVVVDLKNQFPGSFEYELTERNISYNNISPPERMTVLQVNPNHVPLVLEETLQRELPVLPKFAGDPAPGYALEGVRIRPDKVVLSGPRSVMRSAQQVFTRPMDIQDLRNNVEMVASLDMPEGMRLGPQQSPALRALITVSAHPRRMVLRDVPLTFENAEYAYRANLTAVSLQVEGTREALAALGRDKVRAVVDLAKYPPGTYRGLLPAVLAPQTVRVLQQWPALDLQVSKRKIQDEEAPKGASP